jgi:hypothetical protein
LDTKGIRIDGKGGASSKKKHGRANTNETVCCSAAAVMS